MEQNARKNGLINFLVLLVAGSCLYAVGEYSHSLAAQVGSIFLGIGTLVALISLFHLRLESRERLEKLEFEEVAKSGRDTGLFQGEGGDTFPAQRSREQFERFFIPGFTVFLFLQFLGAAYMSWARLKGAAVLPIRQPLVAMGLTGLFALILFLLGKYGSGLARLIGERLLRPGAGYLLFGFYVCVAVVVGIAAYESGFS